MRQRIWEALVFLLLAMLSKPVSTRPHWRPSEAHDSAASYCLSWRLAVEANDIYAWRTVPTQCLKHVENYMTGGQYQRDLNFIMEHIIDYIDTIEVSDDGLDAWILDVDDTCISNLIYYRGKRFGYVRMLSYKQCYCDHNSELGFSPFVGTNPNYSRKAMDPTSVGLTIFPIALLTLLALLGMELFGLYSCFDF